MATYAIGDIQGCYAEFRELLRTVSFNPAKDRLWLLGDLVNRGPDSLALMEHVLSLEGRIVTVLGNHDLHFLAIFYGGHSPNPGDTFDALLASPQVGRIADWFRRQRFFHLDERLGWAMVHAGLAPGWTLAAAARHSQELMGVIQGNGCAAYFRELYGNRPDCFAEHLQGMERWRILTNCFTRMRLVDCAGRLDFSHKGALDDAPSGWLPWYELAAERLEGRRLLFGHWAALDGETGQPNILALDTGCVWGRSLTALCLESGERISVPAGSGGKIDN